MSQDLITKIGESSVYGGNAAYLESQYQLYLQDPGSVDATWRAYFDGLVGGTASVEREALSRVEGFLTALAQSNDSPTARAGVASSQHDKTVNVLQLVEAYRAHGHRSAATNPLDPNKPPLDETLLPQHFALDDGDMAAVFDAHSSLFNQPTSLKEILAALQRTYCGSVGIEFAHIADTEQREWLRHRWESIHGQPNFTKEQKLKILEQLTAAEGLEKFLGLKYVGQKRFSLEGGETLIPMVRHLIEQAGVGGVRELVIGMAHRGRLNVLVNVLGKSPETLFREFEGKEDDEARTGDVKYHKGYSSDVLTAGGGVHLALSFNPSHLEIIAPVAVGSVRSRQRRRRNLEHMDQVIPLVIHGDAAFTGQGVVMETFNFSQARGYEVGGTVHIVINNQVGFTTSNPVDARSSRYCTDVAKMVDAPIFHVNGDDPEAAILVSEIAFEYRMKFKRDVVIDLVCYRRHGHNEADEPSVTQPMMYRYIKAMETTCRKYGNALCQQQVLAEDDVETMALSYRDCLERGDAIVETTTDCYEGKMLVDWQPYIDGQWDEMVDTSIALDRLNQLDAQLLTTLPDSFTLHPVVARLISDREKMAKGELPLNWGFAESMAFASLVTDGYGIRLSGQDSGRGTFAHRHAVLHDYKTGEQWVPLQHISPDQERFTVIDSVLSEEAVLAFEYGFSASDPKTLVIWEAQFGDFCNGAQVVIDQFISSGEQKWGRLCGLVMFLPHGFEGMGPEHSSARLERFMQLCAQHNMQVATPTTPAQIFHLLRRQMLRNFRKPLVVMTPKSLLRHKLAVSSLEDLAEGHFHNIIPEVDQQDEASVKRLVLCCGKVYYDLLAQRRKNEQTKVAVVRIEQLYPFPIDELKALLAKYTSLREVYWCQEEPRNQGVWFSSQHHMHIALGGRMTVKYVGRDFFAAPAVGSAALHKEQQQALVDEALADID